MKLAIVCNVDIQICCSISQIMFDEPLQVESITTQGDPENRDNFVPSYTVQFTRDNVVWIGITDDEENIVVSKSLYFFQLIRTAVLLRLAK